MDIEPTVSTEDETVDADTRAATLTARVDESGDRAFVVVEDGEYLGVVTIRQLNAARRDPDAKVRGFVWHPTTVGRVRQGTDDRSSGRNPPRTSSASTHVSRRV
jgi:hypothetical protein